MKNQDLITQILIFLAAVTSTGYAFFSDEEKIKTIKRTALVAKLLGTVVVAFFIMPAVMEYFNLTIKVTLLVTVFVAFGIEGILNAGVNRIIKTINKDGKDTADN